MPQRLGPDWFPAGGLPPRRAGPFPEATGSQMGEGERDRNWARSADANALFAPSARGGWPEPVYPVRLPLPGVGLPGRLRSPPGSCPRRGADRGPLLARARCAANDCVG